MEKAETATTSELTLKDLNQKYANNEYQIPRQMVGYVPVMDGGVYRVVQICSYRSNKHEFALITFQSVTGEMCAGTMYYPKYAIKVRIEEVDGLLSSKVKGEG